MRKRKFYIAAGVVLAAVCLVVGGIFFAQTHTLEGILGLQDALGQNVSYTIAPEFKAGINVDNAAPLPYELSALLRDVTLKRNLTRKNAIVNGSRVCIYAAMWGNGQDTRHLPDVEIIREEHETYTINVGNTGYRVSSGKETAAAFFDWAMGG